MSRNPFNRPMFNKPNMNQISRHPLGILASSPDLMASASRGMARKMQSGFGTHMNVPTVTQDRLNVQLAAVQGLAGKASEGDQQAVNTLKNIVADSSMPTETRMAADKALNTSAAVNNAAVKMRNVNALEKTLGPAVQKLEELGTSAKEAGIAGALGVGRQVVDPFLQGASRPDAPAPDQESAVQGIARGFGVGSAELADAVKSGIGVAARIPGAVSDAVFAETETATGQANRLLAEKTAELDATINEARNTALPYTPAERQDVIKPADVPKTEAETLAETSAGTSETLAETSAGTSETSGPASKAPVVESEDLVDVIPDTDESPEAPDTPKLMSTLNNPDASPKQKAKAVDDALGLESVADRKEFLKGLLGERAKDIRTDANYNLMMTGLLIAAGDDPNALANIAKGAASGLAGFGKAVGEEAQEVTKEDRALTLQAYEDVRGEEAARVAAERKAFESALDRDATERLTNAQIQARLDVAGVEDETKKWIAKQSNALQRELASLGKNHRERVVRMQLDNAKDIAKLPRGDIAFLLNHMTDDELKSYLIAKNTAKSSLRQGSTLDRKVDDLMGNTVILDRVLEQIGDVDAKDFGPALTDRIKEIARAMVVVEETPTTTTSQFSVVPNQQ